MKHPLNWGILGTGAIARKFARGLAESKTGRLVAAGSRGADTLRGFIEEFPVRGHASYEGLLADSEVDIVYISTPHPFHAQWAIRTAEAGKHILCEKPLTMNAVEARAVIDAARRARVFLMEAFMYRCHPQTARLVGMIKEGAIGRVGLVQAAFSFLASWNPASRLLDPGLGGGGILDVGCYCVSMARLIAGAIEGAPFSDPVEVKGSGCLGQTGVDEIAVGILKFPGGMLAQLTAGVRLPVGNTVHIWGEEGHIEVPSPWVINRDAGPSLLRLHRGGAPVEEIAIEADRGIYAIEADAVAESIESGESPAMSWADSLGNMQTLDRWRAELGLRYEADGNG